MISTSTMIIDENPVPLAAPPPLESTVCDIYLPKLNLISTDNVEPKKIKYSNDDYKKVLKDLNYKFYKGQSIRLNPSTFAMMFFGKEIEVNIGQGGSPPNNNDLTATTVNDPYLKERGNSIYNSEDSYSKSNRNTVPKQNLINDSSNYIQAVQLGGPFIMFMLSEIAAFNTQYQLDVVFDIFKNNNNYKAVIELQALSNPYPQQSMYMSGTYMPIHAWKYKPEQFLSIDWDKYYENIKQAFEMYLPNKQKKYDVYVALDIKHFNDNTLFYIAKSNDSTGNIMLYPKLYKNDGIVIYDVEEKNM